MLPARSPNLNAYAERWARSVKEECLSRRDRVRLTNHASESNPDSPPRTRPAHSCNQPALFEFGNPRTLAINLPCSSLERDFCRRRLSSGFSSGGAISGAAVFGRPRVAVSGAAM